jgi:glutaredoxin
MVTKSGQMGVPVIEINGKIVVGFQPEVFEQLLNK